MKFDHRRINDMVSHMKTTIDIPDNLFFRTKETSQKTGITFKDLVAEGLITVLEKKSAKSSPTIKPVTFQGNGISQPFTDAPWSVIRDSAYEGRGS